MPETDEQLYRRFLADGDSRDLRVLLERHGEALTLFLYGMVRNMEDAEDLMLDAFAEAAAGPTAFSGRSSFRTWLFSIGKNKARAHLRKQRSVTRRAEQAWEDPAESLELALLKKERDRQLYQALRQLRDEYRQVLLLLYFEGMTPEEAGHVLGKGRKQIYNLAQRSRQALRTELERMGFDHAQY